MGERSDPPMSENDSTQAIRRDIERTQREMSHTIDEIQYRLSPAYMKERARESVRRAGVRTSRSTIERVKANPVGAAMVGVGLYLLMRSDDRGHDSYYTRDVHFAGDFDEMAYDRTYGAAYNANRDYRDLEYGEYGAYGEQPGRMAQMRDRVSDSVSDLKDTARERLHDARDTTSDMGDRASARMHEMRDRARMRAMRARSRSRDMMSDSPLIMGLAAAAFGAIVGSMIPETERENEMFGEQADRIKDRAQDLARHGAEQAKHIAKDVASTATETAKRDVRNAKDELRRDVEHGTREEFR